jgi:hypothetical protein
MSPLRISKHRPRRESGAEEVRLVHGWRMVDAARELFAKALSAEVLPQSWQDARRTFTPVDYLALVLIGLFNPTVRSLRGLCQASGLERAQLAWGCGSFSLASMSDAQHLIDPELLRPVIAQLQQKVQHLDTRRECVPQTPAARARAAGLALRAVDSSLFPALSRMLWAAYGGGHPRADGKRSTAVRLHISFDVQGTVPVGYAVSAGAVAEGGVWERDLQNGGTPREEGAPRPVDVGDRCYGGSFAQLERLARGGTSFLVRLRHTEHPDIAAELPLTDEDRAAGVVRQALVRLGKTPRGSKEKRPLIRVIWLSQIVLATNLPADVLSAELAGELYRDRWQVEFFFKWIKCLLGCRHWMAESSRGVTLQLYLVIIMGLLLQLQCGRRPNRRMLELLQFYFQGLVSAEELGARLAKAAAEAETAARSKRLYAQKMAAK